MNAGTTVISLGRRVLVAEDSKGSQMVTEVLLRKAGCEVRVVDDGADRLLRPLPRRVFDVDTHGYVDAKHRWPGGNPPDTRHGR